MHLKLADKELKKNTQVALLFPPKNSPTPI